MDVARIPRACNTEKEEIVIYLIPARWCYREHTASETMQLLLRSHFGNRIISHGADPVWPSRSPNLSCCDFFFCVRIFEVKGVRRKRIAGPSTTRSQHRTRRNSSPYFHRVMLKKVVENFK